MTNVFDTTKIYSTILWGHSFTYFPGSAGNSPELPGTFAADTVEVNGEQYAVFTVQEPVAGEYPAAWVGTYRIPYDKLVSNPPLYIADVPQPEPDPEPEPQPDPDPDPETPGEDGSETDPENNSGE